MVNVSLDRIDKYTRTARTFYNLNRWVCIRIGESMLSTTTPYCSVCVDALGGLFVGFSPDFKVGLSDFVPGRRLGILPGLLPVPQPIQRWFQLEHGVYCLCLLLLPLDNTFLGYRILWHDPVVGAGVERLRDRRQFARANPRIHRY